jgi:hypothetical protein
MRRNLLILGVYSALTLVVLWPLPLFFTKAIPGDGFDGWQNYWNIWWVSKAVLEEHTSPYFTHYLYYPTGVSLLFHTLNLPNGLLAMPIQVLFGPIVAYNFIVIISSALSGYGSFLLALELTGSRWASFLAGLIYAFSPFRSAHLLGHMQVFSTEWIPFFILALFRIRQGKSILLPAVFLVLSSLCDWYQALYLGLFTAIYLGWLAWKKVLTRKEALGVVAAWGIAGLMLSPLLLPMLWEMSRYRFMFTPSEHASLLSADLLAFFIPSEFHPLWGKLAGKIAAHFTASLSERTVSLGYTPLILAFAAWRRKEGISLWLITGLSFVLLALGPYPHVLGRTIHLPLPYAFLRPIPIVAMARSVSRFSLMATLSLAVMAALGAKALGPRILALLMALILLEYWPSPYPFSPPDTPDFYRKLAQEPGQFAILNLPMNWDRPRYLLYQTVHGKPLVSGYISREDPRTLVERMPVLQHFRNLGEDIIKVDLAEVAPSVMAYLGVRYVVLDFYQMPMGEERERTVALATEAFGGSEPIYKDERLVVYRVPAPAKVAPFLFLGDGWGELRDGFRSFKGEATLFLHSPEASTVTVAMEVSSSSGGLLKVWASSFRIRPQEKELISFPVEAKAGDNVLVLGWEPEREGEGLQVWSIRLLDAYFPTLAGQGFASALGPTRGKVANVGNSPLFKVLWGDTPHDPPPGELRPPGPPRFPTPVGRGFAGVLGPTRGKVANVGNSPPFKVLWGDTPHSPPPGGLRPPGPPCFPTLAGRGFAGVLGPTRGRVANVGNSPLFKVLLGDTPHSPPPGELRPPGPPRFPTLAGRGFAGVLGPTRGGVANVGNSPLFKVLWGDTPHDPPPGELRPPGPPRFPTLVGPGFAGVLGPTRGGLTSPPGPSPKLGGENPTLARIFPLPSQGRGPGG